MNCSKAQDLMLLVGRLCGSVLFIVSGYNKFARYDFYVGFFDKLGIPQAPMMVYAAGAFELLGALCLILGFKMRPAAVFLGLYSIAAAALAHANFADPNQLTHFFKNLSILGGFLAFGVAGPGAYSLDAKKNSAENQDTVQDQAN